MAKVSNVGGMLGITFEIEGVAQMARVLGISAKRVKDLRPVWDDIADDFVKKERTLFSRQGSVAGWNAWSPLNPDYVKWKASKGFSTKILRRKGDLRDSLTKRGDSNFIFKPRKLGMEIGTKVPYAKYHQRGVPKNKLPKREPIRITNPQRKGWTKMIQKFVIESGQFERSNLSPKGSQAARWIGGM